MGGPAWRPGLSGTDSFILTSSRTRLAAAVTIFARRQPRSYGWNHATGMDRNSAACRGLGQSSHCRTTLIRGRYGIDLPAGALAAGENRAVTTTDAAGEGVVGRLHARIGDGAVVLLPDGQLVARKAGQFAPTDRPFEPLDQGSARRARLAAEFPGFKIKPDQPLSLCLRHAAKSSPSAPAASWSRCCPGVKGLRGRAEAAGAQPGGAAGRGDVPDRGRVSEVPPHARAASWPITTRSATASSCTSNRGWPRCGPDLAMQQAISTIAHEGAHQILHNIGVQQRLSVWPMWLSEGLAEYLRPDHRDRQAEVERGRPGQRPADVRAGAIPQEQGRRRAQRRADRAHRAGRAG